MTGTDDGLHQSLYLQRSVIDKDRPNDHSRLAESTTSSRWKPFSEWRGKAFLGDSSNRDLERIIFHCGADAISAFLKRSRPVEYVHLHLLTLLQSFKQRQYKSKTLLEGWHLGDTWGFTCTSREDHAGVALLEIYRDSFTLSSSVGLISNYSPNCQIEEKLPGWAVVETELETSVHAFDNTKLVLALPSLFQIQPVH